VGKAYLLQMYYISKKAWEKVKYLLHFILAVKPVLETKISIKKSEKSGNYIPNREGSGSSSRSKKSIKFKILLYIAKHIT